MFSLMPKRIAPLFLAGTSLAIVVGGCASDEAARRADRDARQERYGSVHAAADTDESASATASAGPSRPSSNEMKVDSELGVLDTAAVEATLQGHFDDVRACYRRAGKAQDYAGGRVLMRFLVDGAGHVADVIVVESSLGNYSVERCLVEVGRGVVFEAPTGHRSTTFDYPVEFRSTNEMSVLDIDGLKIDHDLSVFLPQLAACGRLADEAVAAIMYIEPSGFPGSVGLAASVALDESAGNCVVQTIRRWKMSATLPGRVLRANFRIPSVIAVAEPPQRHAASSVSARRRRR
jgi:TonB family protein